MDATDSERLLRELAEARLRIAAYERSRWWRLHPRFALRRAPRPTLVEGAPESFGPEELAALRGDAQSSAAVVAPIMQELVHPRSVVDVGGGEGWWAQAFADLGTRAVSVDAATGDEPAPDVEHVRRDLREPLDELGSFDLALCLEVAEHLESGPGERLVETLCSLAPVILFSAAIPGQGGVGHVNEQWPSYWVERFERRGYRCSGALRWRIWDDDRVAPWYRQNLLVATRAPDSLPEVFEPPTAAPWPVVHPSTFARLRRGTAGASDST